MFTFSFLESNVMQRKFPRKDWHFLHNFKWWMQEFGWVSLGEKMSVANNPSNREFHNNFDEKLFGNISRLFWEIKFLSCVQRKDCFELRSYLKSVAKLTNQESVCRYGQRPLIIAKCVCYLAGWVVAILWFINGNWALFAKLYQRSRTWLLQNKLFDSFSVRRRCGSFKVQLIKWNEVKLN